MITVDCHFVRHERVEGYYLASGVADDLRVGVPPQKQVAHERFPKREARHLGVRLIMEQPVKRMFERLLFAATTVISVNVQR
ncbi:hypothetical protein SDC9_167522 [bioreactor metagenome]|uniref:Uncharacterized protein n=1 Tax=bioreactor metagenome TaxID=1076179 RepID=A0A645G0I1_9ZZZZ